MTTTNFYESLNELVLDSRFRNLTVTQNFENFLNGFGINEAENMFTFSWLLSPKGSHGLKDIFVKEFMTNCWSNINGLYGANFKGFKNLKFYTALSPVFFQSNSFTNCFIDREITKEVSCADMVITDHASKVMIVVNNRYEQAACNKAYTYFNSDKFSYFENKVFVSFDGEVQSHKDGQWMYMNNEWIINLCANIIECPQYNNLKITSYLKDFYQFLTGTQYGTNEHHMADYCATLISDYYEVLSALKTYKAEQITDKCLIDINPREYASLYADKISEKEYGVLSLYWSYRNTFNTFFQNVELEAVTRNLETAVENKGYRFDRKFIRNGFCFTPAFDKVRSDRTFMNTIFDVEMVFDMNKNLTMCLVVNKGSWDKLTTIQRETIQKNFEYSGMILNDRAVVWQNFYRQEWKNKDLGKDVVALFDKVDNYFATLGFKVA